MSMQIFYEEKCNAEELLELNKRAAKPASHEDRFCVLFMYGSQLIRHGIYDLGLNQFEKAIEEAWQLINPKQLTVLNGIDTDTVKIIIKTLYTYHCRKKYKNTTSDTLNKFMHFASLTSLNGFIEGIIANEASRNECLELRKQKHLNNLIGVTTQWLLVLKDINTYSGADKPVLITGPSGIGKELIAQAIGLIRGHACISINCAAIPDELAENQMFGHKRGSFTGATTDRTGFCEIVGKGVLFLDEIDKASKRFQSILLRLLQNGEFYKVGETKPREFLGTIVSATSRNIPKLIEKDLFVTDLYSRLKHFKINVPELSKRPTDIEELIEYYLTIKKDDRKISAETIDMICNYYVVCAHNTNSYNVRDLFALFDWILIRTNNDIVTRSLPQEYLETPQRYDSGYYRIPCFNNYVELKKHELKNALCTFSNNITDVADLFSVTPQAIYGWKKKHSIK